jgi:MbtH protein
MSENEENKNYVVVVNHEEQYSIWPVGADLPSGWREAGMSGKKDDCLQYIKEVWTDMRPLSVRRQLETQGIGMN